MAQHICTWPYTCIAKAQSEVSLAAHLPLALVRSFG